MLSFSTTSMFHRSHTDWQATVAQDGQTTRAWTSFWDKSIPTKAGWREHLSTEWTLRPCYFYKVSTSTSPNKSSTLQTQLSCYSQRSFYIYLQNGRKIGNHYRKVYITSFYVITAFYAKHVSESNYAFTLWHSDMQIVETKMWASENLLWTKLVLKCSCILNLLQYDVDLVAE